MLRIKTKFNRTERYYIPAPQQISEREIESLIKLPQKLNQQPELETWEQNKQ